MSSRQIFRMLFSQEKAQDYPCYLHRRETEAGRDTDRHRHRQAETDRQTETDSKTDRQTDRDRKTERKN